VASGGHRLRRGGPGGEGGIGRTTVSRLGVPQARALPFHQSHHEEGGGWSSPSKSALQRQTGKQCRGAGRRRGLSRARSQAAGTADPGGGEAGWPADSLDPAQNAGVQAPPVLGLGLCSRRGTRRPGAQPAAADHACAWEVEAGGGCRRRRQGAPPAKP